MHARARAVVFLVAALGAPVGAADRFVSVQGSNAANDCLTSTAPCLTIAYALGQASSGDVVKVATGRYSEYPAINASTVMTLSGSWNPDFTSRDAAGRGSKLLGKLLVTAGAGVTIDATVDGFLMTYDGGVQALSTGDGALTVRLLSTGVDFNRVFPGITVSAYDTSTLAIETTDTSVSLNRVRSGAAVELHSFGTAVLTLTMTDSAVEGNFGSVVGTDGIHASGDGTLDIVLTRTRVDRNRGEGLTVRGFGGGPVNVTLMDSSVSRNRSGGIRWFGADVSITNSVIARNQSVGLDVSTNADTVPSTLQVVNSTIRRNRFSCGLRPTCAAGIWVVDGPLATVDLLNTIVWGNRAPGGAADVAIESGATVNIDHSDIGELDGAYNDLGGNIAADPLFVSRRDAHLTGSSPAIDAGTCTGAPATDVDGDARPTGGGCDMGADEYVP